MLFFEGQNVASLINLIVKNVNKVQVTQVTHAHFHKENSMDALQCKNRKTRADNARSRWKADACAGKLSLTS